MRICLPDVSVLIALHDTAHPFHQRAQNWFDTEGKHGWATCPLTENGFIRVYTQTSSLAMAVSLLTAFAILENMASIYGTTHHFWGDSVSLRDPAIFHTSVIAGHKQITDVYLLGLCQHNGGTFVTLDEKMTVAAINLPHTELLHKP